MNEIQKKLNQIDSNIDNIFDTRMLMYRFLSEVERITDERGINRKTLASMLNTSPSYITQLFRGNKIINLDTLAKIEKALGISFEVAARQKNEVKSSPDKSYLSNIDIHELIKMKHAVPDGFWVFHPVEDSKSEIIYSKPTGNHKIVA